MIIAAVLAALLAVRAVVDLVARPTFRRLALRNVDRRRSEAVTIIIGSLLGTAIITAAMVVDNTIDSSIRDFARTQLGPVDEVVATDDLSALDAITVTVSQPPVAGVDGVLRAVSTRAAIAGPGEGGAREVIPDGGLLEVDFDAARAFGGAPAATGLAGAGATPAPGEAVVSSRTARDLRVRAGDRIVAYAYGAETTLVVRAVVPEVGLAGFRSALVAPGTIAALAATRPEGAQPPRGLVLVSNTGGVFDAASGSDAVAGELGRRLRGTTVDITKDKQRLLEVAKEQGRSVGQLYQGIGGFSVIAGVLLLVNLFVMLSEDRKVELGMLRAIGFRRSHVTRAFGVEGLVYSAVASVLGAIAGIGVGWLITRIASNIISAADQDLVFRLSVQWRTLVTGGAVGFVISMATVWLTSARIARHNVIAAIRDLPQPRRVGRPTRRLVLLALGVVVGAWIAAAGISTTTPAAVVLGVPLAVSCLAGLVARVVHGRGPLVVAGAVSVAWCIGVFTFLPDAMEGSTINVFLLQGVILVAASVSILTALDREAGMVLRALARRGGALPARLGLAYPLARRFRTGMLLGMYSLIIFTMTFISVFSAVLGGQTGNLTADAGAGFDLVVDSNPANPVTPARLAAVPGVARTTTMLRAYPEWLADFRTTPLRFPVTGFDESLLAVRAPALSEREPGVLDDAEQFRRVLADPTLVIVDDFFLQTGGGPPADRVHIGDEVQLLDPSDNRPITLRVAGILSADPFLVPTGAYVGADFVRTTLPLTSAASRQYVAAAPGTDAGALAAHLEDELLANGVEARTVRDAVRLNLRTFRNFLALMRGYLALGLLIGIAGLGVVMIRAVRERRREIGMLRAMGVSSLVVRRAFLLEAVFIALQGIVLGVVLGLVTSYSVLTNSTVFGTGSLTFVWPWFSLVAIVVVPLVASLLATALPAARAARIKPAVALRVAD